MKPILGWLRRKKKEAQTEQSKSDTLPLNAENAGVKALPAEPHQPQQLISASGQSVGKQRDHNEDSLFSFSSCMGGERSSAPLGLFAVADGMGGHQYGEVASSTAIRAMANYFLMRFRAYLSNPSEGMDESLQEMMQAAIAEAQHAVTQTAPGSGTTMTAALVLGGQLTIGHVGDSRAMILLPDGRLEVLTRDHSLVKRLQELGQISPDEASTHPQRNVLYRAVGQGDLLEADIFTLPFPQPGTLLLCSDGLWGVLTEKEISSLVANSPNLHSACQELIAAANQAGGPDNISVMLVQLIG